MKKSSYELWIWNICIYHGKLREAFALSAKASYCFSLKVAFSHFFVGANKIYFKLKFNPFIIFDSIDLNVSSETSALKIH